MPASLSINWHGVSCFSIEAKHGDTVVHLVTDPFDPSTGLKLPRNLAADVVTVSHDHLGHNYIEAVKPAGEKKTLVINSPGEYEIGGLFVYGISAPHGKDKGLSTIYRYEIGDLSFAHLGDLGTVIIDEQREVLEDIDVLMLPIGGGPTLGAKEAVEIISQLEPRLVIPMHYALPGLKEKREELDKFLKEIAATKAEHVTKLKIFKKDLPAEETKIIVLDIG